MDKHFPYFFFKKIFKCEQQICFYILIMFVLYLILVWHKVNTTGTIFVASLLQSRYFVDLTYILLLIIELVAEIRSHYFLEIGTICFKLCNLANIYYAFQEPRNSINFVENSLWKETYLLNLYVLVSISKNLLNCV